MDPSRIPARYCLLTVSFACFLLSGPSPTCRAQATAGPTQTAPTDTPAPASTPFPGLPGGVPLTPDPYIVARTPAVTLTFASVQAATSARGPSAASAANVALAASANGAEVTPPATNTVQPVWHYGVFDEINLGFLSDGTAPPPTSVSLQFDTSRAGASVWIQPLDGGTINFQNADGSTGSDPQGVFLTLDAQGTLTFAFQAPAQAGRFQVLLRLDNISSFLPFVVLDPSQDN